MKRVSIKIHPESQQSQPFEKLSFEFFAGLVGAFALGVSLSTLLTLSSFSLSLPAHPSSQLGAVGQLTLAEQKDTPDVLQTTYGKIPGISIVSIENNTPAPVTLLTSTKNIPADVAAPEVTQVTRPLDAESKIINFEVEIARLNLQIEQIKNNSVELVTEFNLSCGIWNDPCALPYATQLEKNNASYAILEKSLSALTEERARLTR